MEWIMFDIDNTLLDFDGASKEALWLTFEKYRIPCNEEIYAIYKDINRQVWEDFEAEKINAMQLRETRFSKLFDALEIRPCSGVVFNSSYLDNLIEVSKPYAGVETLLKDLQGKYKMSVITNGLKEVQRPRLAKLKLDHYFESIIVSDEVGVAKPHIDYFHFAYASIKNPPIKEKVIVVGDNLTSDIIGGNNFGVNTCWISHGKSNDTDIRPDHTINSIHEILDILS